MKELKEFFTNLVLHGDGNLSESTLRESHTALTNFLSKYFEEYYTIMKEFNLFDFERDWLTEYVDYGHKFRFYSDYYKRFHTNIYIDLKHSPFFKSLSEEEKKWFYEKLLEVERLSHESDE